MTTSLELPFSQTSRLTPETNEPAPEAAEFDFAAERQLKTILLPTQTALALHGPDSPEFLTARDQARQQLQQTDIQIAATLLEAATRFLLAENSPLQKRPLAY